jgi:hypothetical protein
MRLCAYFRWLALARVLNVGIVYNLLFPSPSHVARATKGIIVVQVIIIAKKCEVAPILRNNARRDVVCRDVERRRFKRLVEEFSLSVSGVGVTKAKESIRFDIWKALARDYCS